MKVEPLLSLALACAGRGSRRRLGIGRSRLSLGRFVSLQRGARQGLLVDVFGLHRLRLNHVYLGVLARIVVHRLGHLGLRARLVAHLNTCDSAKCMTWSRIAM